METAGKQVDDDELREIMKANGIGRPSTRASIIETLFKRKYTRRVKKLVIPTEMGIQLIDTIQNELLKSAELTGQWEKQLKEIEHGEFGAREFIVNMKKMVNDLVFEVRSEKGKPKMVETIVTQQKKETKTAVKTKTKTISEKNELVGTKCPKCSKGKIIKGKNAFGCNRWNDGCNFRLPFVFMDKKLSESQLQKLIDKGETLKIKGFLQNNEKVDGVLKLNNLFEIEFIKAISESKQKDDSAPLCPKCKIGTIIKGKTAYGCSRWKSGCDFRFSFDEIRVQAKGQPLTKELVLKIMKV